MRITRVLLLTTTLGLASALPAQLAGPYVVGPGGSFPDMTTAISTLNSVGVVAPVSFLVLGNETGPWTLGTFPGQGPANPVLFDGQGTVTISGTQPLLTLNGCASVTFRGFNASLAAGSNGVVVNTGTADCTFVGCDFQAPSATSGSSTGTAAVFNLVGGTGTRIEDSTFGGSYEAMYAQAASDLTTVQNCRITGGGFWIMRCAGSNIVIANNFITGASNYGISCGVSGNTASGANLKIWNNSIFINHPTTSSQYCSLRWYSANTTTEVVGNAIFDNYGATGALNMWCSGALRPALMDYNCLWSNIAGYNCVYAGANLNFAGWQALGFDLNSISADPMYVSPTTTPAVLDLQPGSPCEFVGTILPSVLTDHYHSMRTFPTSIGAHETTGATAASYAVFGGGCAGSAGVPTNTAWPTPVVGLTSTITVGNLPATNVAVMVIGLSNTTASFAPLPFHLAPLGAPGCSARVRFDVMSVIVGSAGSANYNLGVPSMPSLIGLRVYTQAYTIDPGMNLLGMTPSDAATATIGV